MINKTVNKYLTESSQKIKQLETLLKKHDWWYSRSDDQRAYKKGEAERVKIQNLVDEIDGDEAGEANYLYLKYANKNVGLTPEAKKELKQLEKQYK
jgi:formyltetrahydrofolate synthetase